MPTHYVCVEKNTRDAYGLTEMFDSIEQGPSGRARSTDGPDLPY